MRKVGAAGGVILDIKDGKPSFLFLIFFDKKVDKVKESWYYVYSSKRTKQSKEKKR